MSEEMRAIQSLKCRNCGHSTDDEESTWVINARWPVKLRLTGDGSIEYMIAELEDQEVLDRLDLSKVVCDKCQGEDVEVEGMDLTTEPDASGQETSSAE